MSEFKNNNSNTDDFSENGIISSQPHEDKIEKKIYPIYNENNIPITKEFIQNVLKKGGIKEEVHNLELWQKVFVHESYIMHPDMKKVEKEFGTLDCSEEVIQQCSVQLQNDSNEVLEWLGDGIIQGKIAMYLFKRYPDQREGFLTKLRSKLVKTAALSKLALALHFDKYLVISKHVEIVLNARKNFLLLEDAFEAFIGAMMLEFGDEKGELLTTTFITNIFEKKIDFIELIKKDDNYKDQLMRFYQKFFNGTYPKYEQKDIITSVNENGMSSKKFHMIVRDPDNNIIGEGKARTKQEAEQKAAQKALKFFGISTGF